jgi:transcriptional regulator NrdR family protein
MNCMHERSKVMRVHPTPAGDRRRRLCCDCGVLFSTIQAADGEEQPAPKYQKRKPPGKATQADVVALRSLDLTYRQIAERLGISLGKVHSHLAAANNPFLRRVA